MAKRKRKSGGKRKSRKRGLLGMPNGGAMKNTLLFLTSVAAAQAADEGMELLYATDFMKVTAPADGSKAPSINIKKAGASGGAFLLSGAAAVLSKNDWIKAAATGTGVIASKYLKEDVVKPVLGMGAVSDFLNLYKKDMKGTPRLAGNGPARLAGEKVRLA
jgi:hypothetical protein